MEFVFRRLFESRRVVEDNPPTIRRRVAVILFDDWPGRINRRPFLDEVIRHRHMNRVRWATSRHVASHTILRVCMATVRWVTPLTSLNVTLGGCRNVRWLVRIVAS